MEDNYLIPANSKKSQLLLGFLTVVDLFIFLAGLIITVIMLAVVQNPNLRTMILMVLPLLIASFLVLPVPHYHNVLQLITNFIMYINKRRRYYWKGWCATNDQSE